MSRIKAQLTSWWSGLSGRERTLVTWGGILLLFGVVFWGVIEPTQERAAQAEARLHTEKRLLTWVTESADRITHLRGNRSGTQVTAKPLNQLIPESTRRFKIDLIRIQPRGDEIQVWVKTTQFNQFVNWIKFLEEQHGVQVTLMDLAKGQRDGMVEIKRLQLTQG